VPAVTDAQEEEDLYLLDFHADGYRLAESVPAYGSADTFLVDFALFLEAVEFPIERQGETWSGWFHAQDRHFVWRTDLGIVQVGDRHGERVEEQEWLDTDEGTFVSVRTLANWFNMQIQVDPRTQILTLHSAEPLPFQLWRERMLAKYRYRPGERSDVEMIVPDQYHWATMPLIDLSTQFVSQKQGEDRNRSRSTSLALGMDLLKHSVIYSGGFSGDSDGQGASTNRLTVERASLTPETPMFAGVHHYSLGDIYQLSSNLVNNSNTGLGFSINRYPAGRSGNLGRATIAGDAPPGWQVELYRNGVLIEIAAVGADGRYFFPDQEIPFGENIFVAKLFGPQGQTREDRQTIWGGGTDLAEGDYDFNISHIDFDRLLLDGTIDEVSGLPATYATSLRYTRALSADLQMGAGYTRTGLGTRERDGTFADSDYLSLYGSMQLGPGVLQGEAAHQFDAGGALHLEYLTAFKGQKVTVTHAAFGDYVSPATIHSDELDSLNAIAMFGQFGGDEQHAYTLRLTRRNRTEGASDLRLFNQLSTRFGNVSVSNDLDYRVSSGPGTTNGRLRIASRVRGVSVRGQLDYLLTGKQPLTQLSASLNWDVTGRLNNNLTINKRLVDDRDFFFTNLLSLRIRDYDLTFSVSSDLDDNWSVGAGFNIAFGYDERRQDFITDPAGLANTGRATMNVFIDEDNDGIRDPDELPVTWASYRDQETLENLPGALPLAALPVARPVQFDMRHMKLDDPFLVPRTRGFELTTHVGSNVNIDVAVVMTGDIEGHVMSGTTSGTRGVIVTLHDAEGREVARTRSEFDGFYSFNMVPGGDYEVRVTVPGGQGELVQQITLDPQDGYVVLEKIYIFD
jgi:hypothetical protein